LIERAPERSAFTLQPVIMEFVTNQLVEATSQEIAGAAPALLLRHALVQATARDFVRRSQEHLIARPLLERLLGITGDAAALERLRLALLDTLRGRPLIEAGYGPANSVNLLRLLRGNLRGLDAARLGLRGVDLQGVAMQDATLAGATIRESIF